MGCAASVETRESIRKSRKKSLAKSVKKYLDQTNKSCDTNPINNTTPNRDGSARHGRTTNFKANDRLSFALALEDYEYEGSNHTASTSNDSNVICIMRSDKLRFSGAGIRRHSRRKRRRHAGKDDTRIVVLRKPSRLDSTMMKVEERIPTKELKKPLKKITKEKKIVAATSSPYPALLPEKTMRPPRAGRSSTKKPKSLKNMSPLKVVRKSSLLSSRSSSIDDFSKSMRLDEACSREKVLSMSISSKDYLY